MAPGGSRRLAWRTPVRDAALVLLASAGVGAAVNGLRPHGIPFVQKTEYQILVPCPVSTRQAPPIAAGDPAVWEPRTLLLDARPAADFDLWHPPGATSLPYDYLDPAPKPAVERIASSGATRVVVVGDGRDPDSGEQLARELASAGIRNVHFVAGGAPRLRTAAAQRGVR
jgi:rhodanese-related sulfurtransferase